MANWSQMVSYGLDGVGNWSDRTDSDGGGNLISSVAPPVNEMNEYLSFGSILERHDDNGNRTELTREIADGVPSTQLTTYDFRNRPIQVWERGLGGDTVLAEYRYDVLDRRIEKQTSIGILRFLWDGWRLIEEQDSGGATAATYVCGGTYIDEHVAMDRGGRRFYFHANTLFSTAALTNEVGSVVERYSYDIYGAPTLEDATGVDTSRTSSSVGNPFLYTGREWDSETRLYYYRARYLDPAQGRFTTRDPLGMDTLGSLYAYAFNRATRNVDPLGLDWEEEAKLALWWWSNQGWLGYYWVTEFGEGKIPGTAEHTAAVLIDVMKKSPPPGVTPPPPAPAPAPAPGTGGCSVAVRVDFPNKIRDGDTDPLTYTVRAVITIEEGGPTDAKITSLRVTDVKIRKWTGFGADLPDWTNNPGKPSGTDTDQTIWGEVAWSVDDSGLPTKWAAGDSVTVEAEVKTNKCGKDTDKQEYKVP